jgi:hypothetical protein
VKCDDKHKHNAFKSDEAIAIATENKASKEEMNDFSFSTRNEYEKA